MGVFNWLFRGKNESKQERTEFNSKENGIKNEYYANGKLKSKQAYSLGIRNGESIEYHRNGQVSRIMTFINGEVEGTISTFSEAGEVLSEHNYLHGKPHGKQKEFYKGGQLKALHNMDSGSQDGEQLEYYPNGNLSLRIEIKDGEQHGVHEQFFEDDRLDKRAFFWRGKLEGPTEEFDPENNEYSSTIYHFGNDVYTEILGVMIADDSNHMIEAGVVRDGPQNDTAAETNQLMYDYCLKNYMLPNPTLDAFKAVLEAEGSDGPNEALAAFGGMIKLQLEEEEAFYEEKIPDLLVKKLISGIQVSFDRYHEASDPEEKVKICEEEFDERSFAAGNWLNLLAYALMEQSKYELALDAVEKAITHRGLLKGDDSAFRDTKANVLLLMGRTTEALSVINEVLVLDKEMELPKDEHHMTKAKVCYELDQIEECSTSLDAVLKMNPNNAEALQLRDKLN